MSALSEPLSAFRVALRNRDLRRLQLAFAASLMAQWASSVAVVVYVFQAGGAQAVGIGLALRMIPAALAAPFGGALADRFGRRDVMLACDASRFALAIGMVVLVWVDASYVAVIALSAVGGVVGSVFEPAKAALLPELAREPAELTAANVMSSTIDSASVLVAPALAGLVLALTGPPVVLALTAATYLLAVVLIARLPRVGHATDEQREPEKRSADEEESGFWRYAAEGARTVATQPRVRLIVGLMSAQVAVDGALGVLAVTTALELLDMGQGGYGALQAAMGVGGLLGAGAAIGIVARRRLAGPLALGMLLWGLPLVILGVVPAVAVAIPALVIVGLGNTLLDVSAYTLLQRAAPADVLGRVFGVMESLMLAAVALGSLIAAQLIGAVGVSAALIGCGLFLPVIVALAWPALRRVDAKAPAAAPNQDIELVRGVPMFAPLRTAAVETLARRLRPLSVQAGRELIRQGEPGDDYYLIAQGEVEVLVDGELVRVQEAGSGFGEIALLRDTPRTATVRARTPVELRALDRNTFLAAVTGHAPSREAADAVVGSRLAHARPLMAG